LTNIIDDYKKRLKSSEDQLSSYRKAQETNLQLIKTLESQLSQLESEKHQIKISEVKQNQIFVFVRFEKKNGGILLNLE